MMQMCWCLLPLRDRYEKRWEYRETHNMTILSFSLLCLSQLRDWGLWSTQKHLWAAPTCSQRAPAVMEPWTPAAPSQHRHGFPISSQPADMFNLAPAQTVGQSLMHYMRHSPVKAGGISLEVILSQIFNTNRQTSGHQSHRFNTQDGAWGAWSCLMMNYWNRVLFLIMHGMTPLKDFLHCSDVTLSFQTLKSKGAFYKRQGAPHIVAAGTLQIGLWWWRHLWLIKPFVTVCHKGDSSRSP